MSHEKANRFSDYRDIHRGETILVCGCGASLALLERPKHFLTIGVNDVGRSFTPDYLVIVNERSQFARDRYVHIQGTSARVVFTQLERLDVPQSRVVRFRLGRRGGTDRADTNSLHYSNNSPYVAVNLARHLGARRIGLIGVDFTDDHFFGPTGRHPLAGQLPEIDREYATLVAACMAEGIEFVNLSPISRLTSIPRAPITGWLTEEATRGVTPIVGGSSHSGDAGSMTMKVSIERRSPGAVGQFLDALAATIVGLGHAVSREARRATSDRHTLAIVWNGRQIQARGPVLYCEHGWLPRSDYQISPRGINAGSHAAPFKWDRQPLSPSQDAALDTRLAAIKAATFSGYQQYMEAGKEAVRDLPSNFLLVPLQIDSDTNIVRHAPPYLRTMQALIDHVSTLDPPWPVIFKQHPADMRRGDRHLRLRLRRTQDSIWPQSRGNVHQMLKSGQCCGILTINSNVAHDGLLWDVPAIVLGRNIWPSSGECTPFRTAIPKDWTTLAESVATAEARACRRAYMHYLIQLQWSLADASNQHKVTALLEGARRTQGGVAGTALYQAHKLRRQACPTINVVAQNRGWLFETWKRRLASAPQNGFTVVASDKPLRQADAWIFIRATEAAASRDFARTVVQVHDLLDSGRYEPGGERAAVLCCAGLSLTHPRQRTLLESHGVDLSKRHWILQPVGWTCIPSPRLTAKAVPTIAWIGRRAQHDGIDVSGLDVFIEAARALRGHARIVLIGERLEAAATALRRAGVDCCDHGLARFPVERAAEWLARFDAVVICGGADAGPWPLFDAINAGVPVVATRVGWADALLADGLCGRLVDEPAVLGAAVQELLNESAAWRQRRECMRERVAPFSMAAWSQANLELAAALAIRGVQVAA